MTLRMKLDEEHDEGKAEGRAETEARLQPVIDNLKSENDSLLKKIAELEAKIASNQK